LTFVVLNDGRRAAAAAAVMHKLQQVSDCIQLTTGTPVTAAYETVTTIRIND